MQDNTTTETRLARLELLNKALVVIVLLGIGLGAKGKAENQGVVRAASVQLVDADGKVAAELAVRSGQAGLYVMDREGKTRAALFHSDEATGLYISDQDEVTRVGIAQFAHGGGGVALHGPESKGAAVLYFKDAGSLRFFDAQGKVTNSILATPQ